MTTIKSISTSSGESLEIEIPEPSQHDSFFVFGINRGGSSMQNQLIQELCTLSQVPCINVPTCARKMGLDHKNLLNDVVSLFNLRGYCFSGFRYLPKYLESFPLQNYKKTILFRDPRDSLTSRYFSMAYSHRLLDSKKLRIAQERRREKALATSIDVFVMDAAESLRRRCVAYLALVDDFTLVRRYEDIVYDKEKWARDLVRWFDLDVESKEVERIADHFNTFPEVEDRNKRIRAVIPGNYKKHLKPSTIDALNDMFRDVLAKLDYL